MSRFFYTVQIRKKYLKILTMGSLNHCNKARTAIFQAQIQFLFINLSQFGRCYVRHSVSLTLPNAYWLINWEKNPKIRREPFLRAILGHLDEHRSNCSICVVKIIDLLLVTISPNISLDQFGNYQNRKFHENLRAINSKDSKHNQFESLYRE